MNRTMNFPAVVLLTALFVTARTASGLEEAPSRKKPNIVLLISDTDDYEHFGFMGSKIAQTPTLDKLVANGTLFTTAHCPAPLCRPSLASMLSGKLPNQHGIYGNYIDRGGIGKDTIKIARQDHSQTGSRTLVMSPMRRASIGKVR